MNIDQIIIKTLKTNNKFLKITINECRMSQKMKQALLNQIETNEKVIDLF